MTGLAVGLLVIVLAGIGALGWSIAQRRFDIERWAAPGVLVGIALLAITLDAVWNGTRWWFVVAALVAAAAEALRVADRRIEARLVLLASAGLFALGFGLREPSPIAAVIGMAVFVVVLLELGRPLLVGVVEREPKALPATGGLFGASGLLLVMAFSSGSILGVLGAAAFIIAVLVAGYRWYVLDLPWMPVAGAVGQHAAIVLLVLSVIQP
ncbi:MAG: hypothetical protein AAGA99_09805 [Actinomycetota bacterium]